MEINEKSGGNKSLYIHIPFCVSKCKYCDFFSVPCGSENFSTFEENKNPWNNESLAKNKIPDDYVDALCKEIDFRCGMCGENAENEKIALDSLYIGGGTPSLLSKNQLEKIFFQIRRTFFLTENCEITIEVNPDDITQPLLSCYFETGITRISCGIQSMNDGSLRAVKRRSSARINKNAIQLLSRWQKELSVDFICGLPFETEKSFLNGLNFVIKSLKNLNHISMYSLTIEEGTPLAKDAAAGKFACDSEKADKMWFAGRAFLEKNGFFPYEVSNFCKNGGESKHNLKYWNHQDYFGAGAGATGTLYQKGGSGVRWTNVCDVSKYVDFWKNFTAAENHIKMAESFENFYGCFAEKNQEKKLLQTLEPISAKTSEFEFFMMGLRKISGVSKNHFEKIFLHEIPRDFVNLCAEWQKKGLCSIINKNGDVIFTLGKNGSLFLNKFLEEILDFLED